MHKYRWEHVLELSILSLQLLQCKGVGVVNCSGAVVNFTSHQGGTASLIFATIAEISDNTHFCCKLACVLYSLYRSFAETNFGNDQAACRMPAAYKHVFTIHATDSSAKSCLSRTSQMSASIQHCY